MDRQELIDRIDLARRLCGDEGGKGVLANLLDDLRTEQVNKKFREGYVSSVTIQPWATPEEVREALATIGLEHRPDEKKGGGIVSSAPSVMD